MCQGQSQGPLPRAGEGERPCLALNPSPASDWLCYLIALCLSFPICLTGIATTPTAPDRGRIQWVLSREGPGPCPAQSSRSLRQGCLISAQEAAGFRESPACTRLWVGAFAIRKGVSKPSCSSGSPGDLQKTHPTDSECLLSLVGVLFRSSGQGGLAGLHSGLYHRRLIPGKVTRPHWDSVSRSANGLSRGCCQDGRGEVAAFWGTSFSPGSWEALGRGGEGSRPAGPADGLQAGPPAQCAGTGVSAEASLDPAATAPALSLRCSETWRRGGLAVVPPRPEGPGPAFAPPTPLCRRRRAPRRRVYADAGWGGLAGGQLCPWVAPLCAPAHWTLRGITNIRRGPEPCDPAGSASK
ncbi:uncharacterized protein [Equus przewalskii]|uniref:Uncharacterized protein n=1 Tax=Equus przewalskii TaxID=9798 RepID=A0ABM4MLS8_EQUPR